MEQIKKTDNQLVFSVETNETLMNAIRRYVYQINIMAIDELEISKNDSPLYDETIAHRFGLVPLKTAKNIGESSTSELKLHVKKQGIVYSGDLNGKPEPVYENIPMTTLDKGQELKFIASVRSGKGFEHSKFLPGSIFYRNAVIIKTDKDLYNEIKKACPDAEIEEKEQKIIIKDDKKKEIADVCEGIAEKRGKKIEKEIKKELIVTIESFGQTKTEDIFINSINVLKEDLKEVTKQIK